ncbi:kinase-like domain-containing protein [Aspergillus pseudodeflectus]|uniref:Kinase-like domain-containing protein n=1 Tax=Aspergillus pseudodeflectus TaxID=176178 RepID=A0ABR4JJV8_9EURO
MPDCTSRMTQMTNSSERLSSNAKGAWTFAANMSALPTVSCDLTQWVCAQSTKPLNYLVPNICTGIMAQPELFSYTSGRYIYNEDARLRERYVEFDPGALLREVEKHIGLGHGRASRITKLAEGGYNRVFRVTMDDGFEAIAKTPYSSTGPKYYATASEAATLTYLHSKGIPVPRVYGYYSSENNPIGVEYTLMEKAKGILLDTIWFTMSKRNRLTLASSFVDIEKRLFEIPFGSIGSIYFKGDDTAPETFCIEPTAGSLFWDGKRAGMDLYHGPWKNPTEYLRSIAEKEIEWTQRFGKPLELDFPHNAVFPGERLPEDYLTLLHKYLTLAPHLLPKDGDSRLNAPTLRHPDLNPYNIFVSPETGAISCIIDWQHTIIEPRLLAAGYPRAFESPDPEQPLKLEEPSLPSDIETLPNDAKLEAEKLYRRRLLFYYYRIFNGNFNKPHLEALRDPILLLRQHLVDRAGRQWTGNLIALKGALIRMAEYWPRLPDTAGCTEEQLFALNSLVNYWLDRVGGVSEEGWISDDRYDEAVRNIAELKAELIATAEGDEEDLRLLEKGCLFRDREESD